MIKPEIPSDEALRLLALKEYSILDSLPEKEYDDITYIASQICKTPIALISLLDDKRQWFKSHHGLDATETAKEIAFCAHAINDKRNMMIVPDSRKDIRFHDNPLVTDAPYVIFYAGMPLVTTEGYALGTLCVIDNRPNELSAEQVQALKALSDQLMKLFELRKQTFVLDQKVKELEAQNAGLDRFARVAAHDIKSPLGNIILLSEYFKNKYGAILDDEGNELLSLMNTSSYKLVDLIDGILKYSSNTKLLSESKEEIQLTQFIQALFPLVDSKHEVHFQIQSNLDPILYTNKVALEQILINLFTNSIKYNDKDKIEICIKIDDRNDFVRFVISDNGPGIKDEDRERIFKIFETTSNADRSGARGYGIGLATVKSLVEGLGGRIAVSSAPNEGCSFEFTIRK